jgi:PDZ domain-containing protein
VALRAAGYPVTLTGDGAVVESVAQAMPAAGVLQPGDVVVGVDGLPTDTTDTLIQQVRRHAAGDSVELAVERAGERQELTVGTRESPTEPGRPLLGVTVSTRNFHVQLPFPVEVDTANVGGPSAGLMLALGILDGVTDGDLTRGVYVAGTGTLGADGRVGPVAGTAEKALSAERDGAQLFLVPAQNFGDAQRWAHAVRFVPIERFEDAVRALCSLPPPPDETVPPAPCG